MQTHLDALKLPDHLRLGPRRFDPLSDIPF